MDTYEPSIDLRSYLRPLRWGVPIGCILAAATVVALSGTVEAASPTYSASARVLVGPGVVATVPSGTSTVDATTQASLVSSTEVASLAAASLDTDMSVDELQEDVTASVERDSQVVVITFEATDAEEAAAGAEAFAEAYLEHRGATLRAPLLERQRELEDQVAALETELHETGHAVTAAEDDSIEQSLAESDHATAQRKLTTAETALDSVLVQRVDAGSIIERPEVAVEPVSDPERTRLITLALAAVAAFLLGLLLAYVRSGFDRRLYDDRDIEGVVGAPVLGRLSRRSLHGADHDATSRAGLAYRQLRTLVEVQSDAADALRGVTVAALPRTRPWAPAVIAANLAQSIARTGQRVTIATAEVDRPWTQRLFGIADDAPGLTDVLAGSERLSDVLIADAPDLSILPSGTAPEAIDRLAGPAGRQLTATLLDNSVVVAVIPDITAPELLAFERRMNGVVLAVPRSPSLRRLRAACSQLDRSGATITGVVVVPRTGRHPVPIRREDVADGINAHDEGVATAITVPSSETTMTGEAR